MDALRQMVPVATTDPQDVPMTVDEVARLVSSHISIGSHAMSHQPLTSLTQANRRAEIEGGRAMCTGFTDRPVSGFAYPHGDRDTETIAMVREAGFAWACSTRAAGIDPDNYELFDLPRIAAPDAPGTMMLNGIEAATP